MDVCHVKASSPPRQSPKRNPATLFSVAGHRTKWDEDNPSVVNPAAIAAAVVLILFLVGLAVMFALT
jgi:hypothetical protein